MVGREIDALEATHRRLLRCASVLGRSFRVDPLRTVLADDVVNGFASAELATELGRFLEDDGGRWRFRQAIVRDVVYEGLSFRRRRELHGKAGAAIQRLAGSHPEQEAEILALHYQAAQDYAKAWHFARLAADRARRRLCQCRSRCVLRSGARRGPPCRQRLERRTGQDVEGPR